MLKPSASSKGSKNSARTAFSVAQDVERSLGSPRMLHGHLHQLQASSISCMLNRRVLTKFYHVDEGNLLHYKVIYSSRTCMYVVLKKNNPSIHTVFPCIMENSKLKLHRASVIRAGMTSESDSGAAAAVLLLRACVRAWLPV